MVRCVSDDTAVSVNAPYRVSVVMPALNEAARIAQVLAPLQTLRAAGHEIILADGGSTDATCACAAPLVDLVLTCTPGRATQMSAGADAASGDLLWFVHADTQVPPAAITTLLQLNDAENVRKTGHFWGHFRVRIDDDAWVFRMIEWSMNLRTRLTSVVTGDQGLFVSRSLWEQVGGFRPLPLMEDIELSKRLRRQVSAIHLQPQLTTSARRWRSGGTWRTIALMWWLRLAYVLGVSPERLAAWYRPQGGRN